MPGHDYKHEEGVTIDLNGNRIGGSTPGETRGVATATVKTAPNTGSPGVYVAFDVETKRVVTDTERVEVYPRVSPPEAYRVAYKGQSFTVIPGWTHWVAIPTVAGPIQRVYATEEGLGNLIQQIVEDNLSVGEPRA